MPASARCAPGRKSSNINVETFQEALQSSAEIAARLAERSADQFGRVLGISVDEAHKAAQKASDNLDAIVQSNAMLAGLTQSTSREWVNFTRERMEQNFNCPTSTDGLHVQIDVILTGSW